MKLATLRNNSRDGELIIVNKNLTKACSAKDICPTMQSALDNWNDTHSKLMQKFDELEKNKLNDIFTFDANKTTAPLPRAYQWADGSAYVNHVELVRKARGATMPENFWTDPLMYQGGSDSFLGPHDDILMADTSWGIDFEAEIGVITDDVPMGVTPENALEHIKLIVILNDVSLRNLIPNELSKGFGFFQSKPATSFAPVCITPDELGAHWDNGKVTLPLVTYLNNTLFGKPNAGIDMTFDFGTLISHAAKTRFLSAGCIIGSGTVSNLDRSQGSSCIAEKRMLEIINNGKPETEFMQFGDTVTIEMFDQNNQTIFGKISQKVVKYEAI